MSTSEPRDRPRSRGSRASGATGEAAVDGSRWWPWLLLTLSAAVVAAAVLRAVAGPVFLVPSGSMEPTLTPGDRVHVDTAAAGGAGLAHGDVVVFDGAGSLAPSRSRTPLERGLEDVAADWGLGGSRDMFVKRVVGLPGDTLRCCTADGRLERDGAPVDEPYLGRAVDAALPASETTWTFEVPEGRMVVLGDNRSDSRDSRALLGAPGGGLIPLSSVVGRVDEVVWPLGERRPVAGGVAHG